jgi:rifampicin phosphotransferase
MTERGHFEEAIDVFYLTRWETYPWLRGEEVNVKLLKAKIDARRRDVLRFHHKEIEHPLHMRDGVEINLSHDVAEEADGSFKGQGTSPGTVTGTARIVRTLAEIGRVNHGEILVVHATDPGWTPVFLIIKGVVVETGGILAHASCLAREYGFPAVQLPRAMKLIPDGATIEINGATGKVRIIDDGPDPEAGEAPGGDEEPQATPALADSAA